MEDKTCSTCSKSKPIFEFTFPKRKIQIGNVCKECVTSKSKAEYQQRRQQQLEYRKVYYAKNKEEILAKTKTNEYKQDRNAKKKVRRQNDIQFRICDSLKVRIHEVLKEYKDTSSNYLLGCTKAHIKTWLEYQHNDKVNWQNYAEHWHIDHVIPLAFFDMTVKAEQLICFSWMNLRPLDKGYNMSKSSNIVQNDILKHIDVLEEFITKNTEYQECYNSSIWPRIKLGYGQNLTDSEGFEGLLESIIRNQVSS